LEDRLAELDLRGGREPLHRGDRAPHLGPLLRRRLELDRLALLEPRDEEPGEPVEELLLLRALEAGGDAAPDDPPGEAAGFVLLRHQAGVEALPHLADAPVVELGARAGAEQEAGEVEPAGLGLGRGPARRLVDVDRVPEAAAERRRPFVAAGAGQALELL